MEPLDYRQDPTFSPSTPAPREVYDIEGEAYIHYGVGKIIGSVSTLFGKVQVIEVQDIKDGKPYTMLRDMHVMCETLRSNTVDFLAKTENLCVINSIRRHIEKRVEGKSILD